MLLPVPLPALLPALLLTLLTPVPLPAVWACSTRVRQSWSQYHHALPALLCCGRATHSPGATALQARVSIAAGQTRGFSYRARGQPSA